MSQSAHVPGGSRLKKYRPFGYERVLLPHYKVADTLFHIQGDDMWDEHRRNVATDFAIFRIKYFH